ncbi:MAG: prepilin-type N-terminal cleavage/methylation domain-containing protein [Phycisphaerales bacterium]|nr:prepilin-type N-terminal cleavage/methylation domain-containing protein [Phycisphaerales bacterium]
MWLDHPKFTSRGRRRRGFTLIEAALVTVIVGVGVVSMLRLLAAGTFVNAQSAQTTTAMNLASNLHEAMLRMSLDQVAAMNNVTYSPAVDSDLSEITTMSSWSQKVAVQYVQPDNLTANASSKTTAALVTITVLHNGEVVYASRRLVTSAQ